MTCVKNTTVHKLKMHQRKLNCFKFVKFNHCISYYTIINTQLGANFAANITIEDTLCK